jgi:dCTP deaminase
MYLSGEEIFKRRDELFPDISLFDKAHLQEASYDLRLGEQVFLSDQKTPLQLSDDNPFVVIPPGEFALLMSYEKISVPRTLIGFITIRLKYKLQGLINVSGFHVDPRYSGHLIFSVQNVGPNDIRLFYKSEPVFTVFWAEVKGEIPAGVEKKGPRKSHNRISGEQMSQLGGGSVTLGTLKRDIERLDHIVKVYAPILIALFLSILGLLISRTFR